MSLTRKEVEHIAELARLRLTPQELEEYREQLSDILAHAEKLQSVDTTGIPPTSSVLPPRSVLRADLVQPGFETEDLLRNAPHKKDDQFQVPPVLE